MKINKKKIMAVVIMTPWSILVPIFYKIADVVNHAFIGGCMGGH